ANAFQVSRMPVREALRSLETQGYIAAQYQGSQQNSDKIVRYAIVCG
ncbi:GntR family transcriptional regulator, partial [Pseudomonas amygdali pv. mori str. 301020]